MKNIESLKKKLEINTSEQLFGINKQPELQCQEINKMQKDIENGCNEIERYCKDLKNTEDAESLGSDIESSLSYYMWDKISELEDLRKEIENIRSWGQGWKDLAKSVLNNISNEDDLVHYLSDDHQIKYDTLNDDVSYSISTQWVSITERLPKNGQRVIVCRKNETNVMGLITYRSHFGNNWGDSMLDYFASPTHWMELPEVPI
jgi:hypothetical protein